MSQKKIKKIGKVQYYILTTIILTIIGVWFVTGMALLFMLDWKIGNPDTFNVWKMIFFGSMIAGAVCSLIMIALRIWKPFWNYSIKRESAGYAVKEKRQHIKELVDYDYSVLPEYQGKNIFRINGNSFFYWIWGIYFTYVIIVDNIAVDGGDLLKSFLWSIPIALMAGAFTLFIYSKGKVKIDETGVHLIKKSKQVQSIKWEKIKTVGISVNMFGHRTMFAFIYFSTRTKKNNIVIDEYKVSKSMIMLKPRPQVIHCIKKYYYGEIKGLDMRKEWHRYLENL